eukprot:g1932.t1
MSLNGVYFERASNAMVDQNVFWQSFQCGLWGIWFNGLVFCTKVQTWRGAFHDFDGRTIMAVLGIVGADISACIFFKFCGATAYSYVRVVSMLIASALSVWLLDFVLTARTMSTVKGYMAENVVSHAGVAVSGWAGSFDCGVCGRKRLLASEFSKKMLEKKRRDSTMAIKCKSCVETQATEEREAAAKKKKSAVGEPSSIFDAGGGEKPELHECARCKQSLPADAFNKNQLRNKGPGKQRCKECVAAAEKEEAAAVTKSRETKQTAGLREAKQKAQRAEACGTAAQKLAASSALAAAEAELVTGLKPMVLGRGRRGRGGRGRGGKGKGTWRGRSRGR